MMQDFSNFVNIQYDAQFADHGPVPAVANPHSTIIFLGDADVHELHKDEILDALATVDNNYFQYVNPLGYAGFGPNNDIPVLKIEQTDTMTRIHRDVTDALLSVGMESASEFGYSPHVTVSLPTALGTVPKFVLLKPAVLRFKGVNYHFGGHKRAMQSGSGTTVKRRFWHED